MKFEYKKICALILCAALLLMPVSARGEEAVPARVTDISDRSYESAVIGLIDSARESISVSMYTISPGPAANNPVSLLVNDLVEARARGVDVTLYLNSRFAPSEDVSLPLARDALLDKLNQKHVRRIKPKTDTAQYKPYLVAIVVIDLPEIS